MIPTFNDNPGQRHASSCQPRRWVGLVAAVCLLAMPVFSPAQESPEPTLGNLVREARNLPDQAGRVASLALATESALGERSERSIARLIRAQALLIAGSESEARPLLIELSEDNRADPSRQVAREGARILLTLMDRKAVEETLRRYYGRNLRYPDSLQALQEAFPETPVRMEDRWGQPWEYRLTAPRFFAVGDGQTFELKSSGTGEHRRLETLLRQPHAGDLRFFEPTSVMARGGSMVVTFRHRHTRQEVTLSEGTRGDGLWFIKEEGNTLFISNGIHFHGVSASR